MKIDQTSMELAKLKVIFCDLDGTLLSNDDKYPDQTFFDLIPQLKQQGIKFVLTTGRLFEEAFSIYQYCKLDPEFSPFIIACNGAQIFDTKNGVFVKNLTFDQATRELIWTNLLKLHEQFPLIQSILYFNNNHIALFPTNVTMQKNLIAHKEALGDVTKTSHVFINYDLDHLTNKNIILHESVPYAQWNQVSLSDLTNLNKIVILIYNDQVSGVNQYVQTHFLSEAIDLSFSSRHSLEISPSQSTKGIAVNQVSQLLKTPLDFCLVCGDSGNDLSMFKLSSVTSICPTWAVDVVKAAAMHHFDGVAAQWVIDGIKKFI